MKQHEPPRPAQQLLALVAGRENESIPGDLTEEFHARAAAGPGRASLWYWRQVLRSARPIAWSRMSNNPWSRGTFAVLAGYILTMALVTITDLAAGVFLPHVFTLDNQQALILYCWLSLVEGFGFIILGGYVTARIARRASAAAILASFTLLMSVIYLLASKGNGKEPLWYLIGLSVALPPGALLGGYLRFRETRPPHQPPHALSSSV
ncbi:MAG: permease prefix domain 2-containing transporter [Bryobacteraceae bacterium]